MKKFISILLTIALLVTMAIFPTNAANELYNVPSGNAYKISYGRVGAFSNGQTVTIPLIISNIAETNGIFGFDIVLKLNSNYVAAVSQSDSLSEANSDNQTLKGLNGTKGNWTAVSRTDSNGDLIITIMDENAETVAKPGNELTINVPVKAVANSKTSEWICVATCADGTNYDVDAVTGSGAWCFVDGSGTVPTIPPVATPKPTADPAMPLSGDLYANIDYTAGDVEDRMGNYKYEYDYSLCDPMTIEKDDEIGKDVLVIDEYNYGSVVYSNKEDFSFLNYNLYDGVTVEMYVKLDGDAATGRNTKLMEMGIGYFGITEYSNMSCFNVNDGSDEGKAGTEGKLFPHDEWIHIVGTSDDLETKLYVNGVLCGTYTRTGTEITEKNNINIADLYIADTINGTAYGDMHFEGKIAFVRIYKTWATDDEVAAMYKYSTGKTVATPTPEPTATPKPTPTPTPEPTATPVPEKQIRYLSVAHKSNRLWYYLGDELETEGIAVRVFYTDMTSEVIEYGPDSGIEIVSPDIYLTGGQYVVLKYKGWETRFSVRYGGRSDVRGIRITAKPAKLSYKQGERFDPSGIVVKALAQDLTVSFQIPVEELEFKSFRNDEAGVVTVKVFYMDYYDTGFSVRVTDEKLLSALTVTKPTKVSYKVGDTFDTTGMTITAKYYDSTTAVIPASKATITGFDSKTTGVQLITVSYGGKSASFSIKVNP